MKMTPRDEDISIAFAVYFVRELGVVGGIAGDDSDCLPPFLSSMIFNIA
jgi:hypothetical protein